MQEYRRKRDFNKTPEPPAKNEPVDKSRSAELNFVVHKHAARRLHYDFRLELVGVLKSWAIPHGPTLDPAIKRLAVMVEDHPLEYASFEGVIPKGEYGAGQVIIWDSGTYVPVTGGHPFTGDRAAAEDLMQKGIEKGKIIIFLYGHKLKGEFTLVKMKNGKNNWLFLKHRDEYTNTSDILADDSSVVSGLTTGDLKTGVLPGALRGGQTDPVKPDKISGSRSVDFPTGISPMLATLTEAPFSGTGWLFEPKLDGYRTIVFIRNGNITIHSRQGLDVTDQYGYLAAKLADQPVKEMILDGEIIALDEQGKNCFQCLQNYLKSLRGAGVRRQSLKFPLIYYVFDLLYLDGYDLSLVPLHQRKILLRDYLRTSDNIRLVEYFTGNGELIYRAAVDNGLEGIIAKRVDSPYEAGHRSHSWLKIKATLSDDFIVGGYSRGLGNRSRTFGSLLLGQYDDAGNLVYTGAVGSGFDEKLLGNLRQVLDEMRTVRCPFFVKPPLKSPSIWVRPEIVIEVKFARRTDDGLLRAPVFRRVREDKTAAEVRKAEPLDNPVGGSSILNIKSDPAPTGSKIVDKHTPDSITTVIDQLQEKNQKFELIVNGHTVAVNNLDKELWPATGSRQALTKRDLLMYLAKVSPYLLPHLEDRLITLSRYPDGIYGEQFFQKHWPNPPEFVARFPITREHEGVREYLACNNLATLLWLGQLADIELHTWFSRVAAEPDRPDDLADEKPYTLARYPDFIVFDLDPYLYSGKEKSGAEPELNRQAFQAVCEVALWIKELLESLSLTAFVKTSGKTGLHIFVPVKRRFTFDEVRAAAKTICLYVNRSHPKETTVEWAVEKRTGKVFLDYNQNTFGKTLASIYSPRPVPGAPISMPLRWEELGGVYPADFTILNAFERFEATGDLWINIMNSKHDLEGLMK